MWNKQGEIGVLHAAGFHHPVKYFLYFFPNRIPIWSNDHRTFDRCVIGKLSLEDYIGIPVREILRFLFQFFFLKLRFHVSKAFLQQLHHLYPQQSRRIHDFRLEPPASTLRTKTARFVEEKNSPPPRPFSQLNLPFCNI